ncbi:MAG: hypothetical protein M3Z49_13390, partial [Bifidobacteriales bacterium]|nr:hypothetical protein [Bifidobacteriales bacterium]
MKEGIVNVSLTLALYINRTLVAPPPMCEYLVISLSGENIIGAVEWYQPLSVGFLVLVVQLKLLASELELRC